MSTRPITCNHERLIRSLDDTLPEAEEEALARHLDDCPSCQQELQRLACERDQSLALCEALRSDVPPAEAHPGQGDEVSYNEPADFAVDFLEPSPKQGTLGRLGDIDILAVIGRGGMGIVLKGFQPELNRPVAVKVLAPHLATSAAARKRFAREAQATAAIVHPNVMPIITVESAGKLPYLVMPYVACESLQQRLDRQGPLEVVDVLRIGVQAARGLAAAHAQGLVHRDIKPANILLEKGVGRVMLTDFGLARAVDDASLTRTGVIAGTPQYMSPEQARGETIDARSDLFSLGSVLYTMCAGRPPFRAETSYGILRRITDSQPRALSEVAPNVPEWLEAIIGKLHAKQPADRFASATEAAELLEQCLAHVQQPAAVPLPEAAVELTALQKPVDVPTPTDSQRAQKPIRVWRRRGVLSAIAIGGLALAAFLATRSHFPSAPVAVEAENSTDALAAEANAETSGSVNPPPISLDWDQVAHEMDELTSDAAELEERVEQFWDRPLSDGIFSPLPEDSSHPQQETAP